MTDPKELSRIEAKIERLPWSGCWIWTDALTYGYGKIWIYGTMKSAHRVVYESLRGPIPDGLFLDHLCRVRCCVNPDHLEPVTNRENLIRSRTLITHCKNGHPYDAIYRDFKGQYRGCLTCRKSNKEAFIARRNESCRA